MYRFWAPIIEPVLLDLAPKVIVEVGSQSGANTENILTFCETNAARCHIIDPLVPDNYEAIQERLSASGTYHPAASLDVLPEIMDADAYLIDGDHNWFTVFHELKTIANVATGGPLIILHDVGWPYGARDLYYDPERIPAEHRQPYARGGLMPGVEELVEDGGINAHLLHAVREGGPKNGVRRAVEDFIEAQEGHWVFRQLPGINGLGFVYPRRRAEEPFGRRIQSICTLVPTHKRYVEAIERDRLALIMGRADLQREVGRLSEALRAAREETAATESRLASIENSGGYQTLRRFQLARRTLQDAVKRNLPGSGGQ